MYLWRIPDWIKYVVTCARHSGVATPPQMETPPTSCSDAHRTIIKDSGRFPAFSSALQPADVELRPIFMGPKNSADPNTKSLRATSPIPTVVASRRLKKKRKLVQHTNGLEIVLPPSSKTASESGKDSTTREKTLPETLEKGPTSNNSTNQTPWQDRGGLTKGDTTSKASSSSASRSSSSGALSSPSPTVSRLTPGPPAAPRIRSGVNFFIVVADARVEGSSVNITTRSRAPGERFRASRETCRVSIGGVTHSEGARPQGLAPEPRGDHR